MAKASIIEAQNHLIDAVDRGYIGEEIREAHDPEPRTGNLEPGTRTKNTNLELSIQNAELAV
jgi:hypothetical protein